MIQIGLVNRLTAWRYIQVGMLLKDMGSEDVAFLPARDVPRDMEPGEIVEAFCFHDNQGRYVASLKKPRVMLWQFGYLKVKDINHLGAFLDWGIDKDLFVPFSEQARRMEFDRTYLVYLRLDDVTGRIVASSRSHRYLESEDVKLERGQEVNLLITGRTDLGYKAIIDDKYSGMLYHDEIYKDLRMGHRTTGYVKGVRHDGKVDLMAKPMGYASVGPEAEKMVKFLEKRGGFMPLTDKSSPEEIKKMLGMSKKAFKKAVGMLYKARRITIEKTGIYLQEED